jgi:hypothetical protein
MGLCGLGIGFIASMFYGLLKTILKAEYRPEIPKEKNKVG